MSEQKDAFLNMKNGYNFHRDRQSNYRSKTIDPGAFQAWTKNYMYQTSYTQHHGQGLVAQKNTAIPGYTGYIPSVKPDNYYGKTYTMTVRQCLSQGELRQNPYKLSIKGVTQNKQALIDKTKRATSSKYGKSSLQKAHPAWNASSWQPTAHEHFRDPRKVQSPTFRPTDKNLETVKANTKESGFSRNNTNGDGNGWKPDPILAGDNHRTEYRDRFDTDHPFHRNINLSKPPKLPKKQLNYGFN